MLGFPYGEAWETLADKGSLVLLLVDPSQLSKGNEIEPVGFLTELEDITKAYIAGAMGMWKPYRKINYGIQKEGIFLPLSRWI